MSTVRKSLLGFIFSGSAMRRWNDKLRPVQLYEIDKQAHKMITAFLLYRTSCRGLSGKEKTDLGARVIEGGLFDYLYRLVITDIKPPVYYRIKENSEHFRELTKWVLSDLEPLVRPSGEGFWQRLHEYHMRPFSGSAAPTAADRILQAAHLYASQWEFNIIKPFNGFDEELEGIDLSFRDGLAALADVPGVADLMQGSGSALGRTANLCGQLRFQIRWSQIPRIPETGVLGHMLCVASYSYFMSLAMGLCKTRCVNNFFAGLFHDLPELLTRDIISPVKSSIAHLPSLIHEYEEEELNRRIFTPLIEAGFEDIKERLAYYLGVGMESEFLETARDPDGKAKVFRSFDELDRHCGADGSDAKDGHLIKAADKLAAYIEAYSSASNGVTAAGLHESIARLRREIASIRLGSFDLRALLADFD
ncbi:MAG: HD domain-containing protein [Mailhella sp.]|nr:HD domain-containing protein [Mailhella sp.]